MGELSMGVFKFHGLPEDCPWPDPAKTLAPAGGLIAGGVMRVYMAGIWSLHQHTEICPECLEPLWDIYLQWDVVGH